mgnify:CR=1 FL=1
MSRQNPTPYDGTRIFKPAEPIDDLVARTEKRLQAMSARERSVMAGADVYRRIYAEAETFMAGQETLSLAEAARKQGVSKAEFTSMADRGEAVLIELEGKQYVPACTFGADGKVDPLKVDIAREFVLEGQHVFFKYVAFMKFMNEERTEISDLLLDDKKLTTLFNKAGVADFKCQISVQASMNQLADRRSENPQMYGRLIAALDSALTHGGWDPSGGLSRTFRDKYNIPGQTIDESRRAATAAPPTNKAAKPPKP